MREYAPTPLPADVVSRILDAGRLAGSSTNKQPWTFVVAQPEPLADAVYVPATVRGAALVVAIVVRGKGPVSFDAGRAAQNMLLAAWSEGVGSCPNGVADEELARSTLGIAEDERIAIVLTFGYPARPKDPTSRTAEEWSARAKRKPLDEVVRR